MITAIKIFVVRAVLFSILWWLLTNGAGNAWAIGLPTIIFSALASTMLLPAQSWNFLGLLRFIPYFTWHSLRGGVDVARRALHSDLPIAPGLYDYRFRLPPGIARVFMANALNNF